MTTYRISQLAERAEPEAIEGGPRVHLPTELAGGVTE